MTGTEASTPLDDAFFRSILDSLPLMVFVKDPADLKFELVNRAGEALLGLSRQEVIGRTDHDFFTRDQADFFQAKDRETLASTHPVVITEEPITTPRGVRWLHTIKMAMRDEAGVARHLLGISEDITVEREHAEKLRGAQKMEQMGRLAAGLAHDFNNLLTVIVGNAEAATQDLKDGDPNRDYLADITLAGARAAELTRQLLSFSRVDGRAARTFNLNEVVTASERLLRRLLEESIDLNTVLAPGMLPVMGAPSAIEHVLMNLVVNARDAMPSGGTITVETANVEIDETFAQGHPGATLGPHAMLAVSDTGTGMDKATMARVFEAFFTTKPAGAGSGLGLWNVYGTVRHLGGTIWVTSELGAGTTFRVYLPRAAFGPAGHGTPVVTTAPTLRGKETVLVVEDDPQVLRVVTVALRSNGYQVLPANGPGEALLVSEQHAGDIDLVLTDVVMPLLNGPQLADRLRSARPAMKVAFMSGYTTNLTPHEGPGVVLIQKPFSTSTLLQQIRDALTFHVPKTRTNLSI